MVGLNVRAVECGMVAAEQETFSRWNPDSATVWQFSLAVCRCHFAATNAAGDDLDVLRAVKSLSPAVVITSLA
jgi:hypothetical protein